MNNSKQVELILLQKGSSVRIADSELRVLKGTVQLKMHEKVLEMGKGKSLGFPESFKENLILKANFHSS